MLTAVMFIYKPTRGADGEVAGGGGACSPPPMLECAFVFQSRHRNRVLWRARRPIVILWATFDSTIIRRELCAGGVAQVGTGFKTKALLSTSASSLATGIERDRHHQPPEHPSETRTDGRVSLHNGGVGLTVTSEPLTARFQHRGGRGLEWQILATYQASGTHPRSRTLRPRASFSIARPDSHKYGGGGAHSRGLPKPGHRWRRFRSRTPYSAHKI